MKKRILSIVLALVLCVGLLSVNAWCAGARLSPQKLIVDGQAVDCQKYNIGGSNFFKLRDLACLLDGTGSQFNLSWDASTATVSIKRGEGYTPIAGDLVVGEDKSSSAVLSSQTILIDGEVCSGLTVYNIGGNNFFKIRELADVLGFDVEYEQATNTAIVLSRTAMDAELNRAKDAGFVPEDWGTNMSKIITFKEFSGLVMYAEKFGGGDNEAKLANLLAGAMQSNEPMDVEDGYFMLAYLWELEGYKNTHIKRVLENDWFHLSDVQRQQHLQKLSGDYPRLSGSQRLLYEAVQQFPMLMSPVSGEFIFEYDTENTSLHLTEPLSREMAVRALLRLLECYRVELDPNWGSYVSLDEVGTYDKRIITNELLTAESALPEVTQAQLPTQWKGAGIASRKAYAEEYLHYSESDIYFLSNYGFNFTRLYLGFETLRYPDYPADVRMVNENELKELDQLLAWCMEYGVHLQISMNAYLNADGSDKEQGAGMPENDAEWGIVRDYWTMLAARYADIPSKYLSFDLCNEGEPREESGKNFEYARKGLKSVVDSVRGADPNRVLLYSQDDRENRAWTEAFAEMGVAVGCHVYSPNSALIGHHELESNPEAEMCWPQPYFPVGLVGERKAKITLTGEVDDATLKFHVEKSGKSPVVAVYADGKSIANLTLKGTLGESGDYFHDGYYSVQIPEGVEDVKIEVVRDVVWFATFILERDGVKTVMMPSDAYGARDMTAPLPLVINGDGTYANSKNSYCDEEWIYETSIKPVKDIAEEHGVGFMVNEFGVGSTKAYWNIDTVAAFHETYLSMLKNYDIAWSYLEISNVFPKHLVILYGSESQWAGAAVEEVTYTFNDGSAETIRICSELAELFKQYNSK